jgi:methionyl-tRNA synthetase
MKTFYLTTPIYYPNARPHVGSAYTTIVCDTIARFKRQQGYDVAFLTGTDEHGEKLERAATQAGMTPSQFVAEKRKLFVALWKRLGIELTHFIYTDRPDHVIATQRMLLRARAHGYVDKRRYEGRYCIFDERYISDNTDPVDCDICGRPAELISEDNYFFKLSAFADRLLEHYEKCPDFVQPSFRRNEVISFVKSGLRDISVSRRRVKWGIPWPDDPEQVFYVWYDALTSYMTGIGFAEGENGSAEFQKYWPADLHMMAKDILRFHAIYWPAFLMAADLPLPKAVFAHGWIYYEQDKMSKSKGNVVYPEPIVDVLGGDALRYYLLRDTTFGQDTSFSYDGLITRFNSDLANDFGNLASRTINMISRYFDSVVPAPVQIGGEADASGRAVVASLAEALESVPVLFGKYDFSGGLQKLWQLMGSVNQHITDSQPWVLARDPENRGKLANVLFLAAKALRVAVVLSYPVLPVSAEKLWKQLGQAGELRDFRIDHANWQDFLPATKLGESEPVFPRIDKAATIRKLDELMDAEREKEAAQKECKPKVDQPTPSQPEPKAEAASPAPPSAAAAPALAAAAVEPSVKISIDEFSKVDLRVGEILAAEAIPGAKKLLKLQVDIGTEVRQLCAGIAEHYKPDELIGMKVVIVANLLPRKLRGIESNGMIVAASVGPHGKPVLATFKEDVEKGARLK